MKLKQLTMDFLVLVCTELNKWWTNRFDIILDQTRSISSGVEKSHGTRLSDQSIDETMRKPAASKADADGAKVPEPFDVNKRSSSTTNSQNLFCIY